MRRRVHTSTYEYRRVQTCTHVYRKRLHNGHSVTHTQPITQPRSRGEAGEMQSEGMCNNIAAVVLSERSEFYP
jgi:hypothetical protein